MTSDDRPRWLTAEEQDAWRAVSLLLLRLPRVLDAQLLRDSGITMFEYFVLSWLSMSPGRQLSMTQLAELSNGSPSRLSNVAKRLEARGWISRCSDPADGRTTVASLTEEGWQVVVRAAPGHVEAVRDLVIDPLSPTQIRQLRAIGRRIGDALATAYHGPV